MSIKRQTLWNLAPQMVPAVLGFFSMPWFLSYLGTEMYAVWGYIITFTQTFGFADLGLGVAVGRFVGVALGENDQTAVRGYWGTGNLFLLPLLLLISLGFVGLGVWLGPKWFHVGPANVRQFQWCFVAGGFGLFFGYYNNYWLMLSQAYLDFKFIGMVRVTMTLLQILPAIGLAYYTHQPVWLVAWSAFVSLLQLGVLIWHARRHYQLGLNFRFANLAQAREMAGYTGKTFLAVFAGSFLSSIDRTILGRLAPTTDFTPYFFSGNIAQRLQSLSASVMGPVFNNTNRVAGNRALQAARIYNDTFAFVFEWYLFAALWLGLWHPVLLRLWLIHTMGVEKGLATAQVVGPLLIPMVAACCFTAMANISNAQLASLNRMGTTVGFSVGAGLLAALGVLIGWKTAGLIGAAYGFLFSRIIFIAQDLYTIRLIKGGGWLDSGTWRKVAAQGLVAAIFSLAYLAGDEFSYWLVIPAALHAVLVAAWILRRQLGKILASLKN